MKKYTAIILWNGADSPREDIETKSQILRAAGVSSVCISAVDVPNITERMPGFITLAERKPIGSFQAVLRALTYFQTSHINSNSGLIIVYSGAPFTERTLSRLMQISSITTVRKTIRGFVSIRATKGTKKRRYETDTGGIINRSFDAQQGSELCGLFLLTPTLLKSLKGCPAKKMTEFIDWCLANSHQIYAIVDGCCGDPYSLT